MKRGKKKQQQKQKQKQKQQQQNNNVKSKRLEMYEVLYCRTIARALHSLHKIVIKCTEFILIFKLLGLN